MKELPLRRRLVGEDVALLQGRIDGVARGSARTAVAVRRRRRQRRAHFVWVGKGVGVIGFCARRDCALALVLEPYLHLARRDAELFGKPLADLHGGEFVRHEHLLEHLQGRSRDLPAGRLSFALLRPRVLGGDGLEFFVARVVVGVRGEFCLVRRRLGGVHHRERVSRRSSSHAMASENAGQDSLAKVVAASVIKGAHLEMQCIVNFIC